VGMVRVSCGHLWVVRGLSGRGDEGYACFWLDWGSVLKDGRFLIFFVGGLMTRMHWVVLGILCVVLWSYAKQISRLYAWSNLLNEKVNGAPEQPWSWNPLR
jgi:hypothetical protein